MGTWHRAASAKEVVGSGRPPKLLRRDDKHKPASVKELALALPTRAWRTITWREATGEKLSEDPQHAVPGHGQMKPEQLEIARLKREVAKLKAERDILKSI